MNKPSNVQNDNATDYYKSVALFVMSQLI